MAEPISAEFTDRQTLEAWLGDKPHAMCSAIATRAALRVLPLAFRFSEATPDEVKRAKQTALSACRAAFVSWAANVHAREDGYQAILRGARAAAGEFDKVIAASAHEYAAAIAAAAAAGGDPAFTPTPENVAFIKSRVGLAARACDNAAAAADPSDIWASVHADARWSMDSGGEALIEQPLWLIDVRGNPPTFSVNFPLWAREPFDAFDQSSWVKQGPWGVWLAWYRRILSPTRRRELPGVLGGQTEIAIATKDKDFWEDDPDAVTSEIADIAGWKWERPAQPPPTTQPPPPPPPSTIESVASQSDVPTRDDQLGRRPFAQALVERMDKIFEENRDGDGFAVHIHAPWGAGKTSVLLMMSDLMTDKDRKSDGKSAPRWVVVQFNGWEHERRNPPWWPLVEKVKAQCLRRLSGTRVGWADVCRAGLKTLWYGGEGWQRREHEQAALLEARWTWWRLKTDALPYVLAAAVGLIFLWIVRDASAGTALDLPLKLFTAALAGYAAFFSASRVAVFGSETGARFYESISQDPLKRITALFTKIVDKTDRPVCVFIDDLDRCQADYVVDLLEGIQTSFRHRKVAYIVAADRNWLKASFEARYGDTFASAVGSPGQPLGYLFLEKIFQVSTPVPGMGTTTRAAYWSRLLKPTEARQQAGQPAGIADASAPLSNREAKKEFDRKVESIRAELREQHGDNLTRNNAEAILRKGDTEEDRAAVILELNASRAAEKEAKHLLEQFSDILPDNPRVMKRMINAFAMRQAIGLLERSSISSQVLARWTILEQRYPALADLLIVNSEWTATLTENIDDKSREHVPPLLLPFINSDVIRSIIGKTGDHLLTADGVRAITKGSAT